MCERDDIECLRQPGSYSFNFISMVPNMTIPANGVALFNLHTVSWDGRLAYELKIIDVRAPRDVDTATEHHFRLTETHSGANLYLVRPLDGPQDVEIDLTMRVFTRTGEPNGASVAKLFVLVSEYPF